MSVTNVQHLAILGLASMAFADLANAAGDSGNQALNEMFNEGGVGFEASQAIKAVMSKPLDVQSGVQIALHLLRVAKHPLADIFDAIQAGELKSCIHSHRHGVDAFLVRVEKDEDLAKVLMEVDSSRFELERDDEYLDSTVMTFHELAPMDLRAVDVQDSEDEAEAV